MNLMAQNSMLRSNISDNVSTVIDSLDNLHFDEIKNYVNIEVNKNKDVIISNQLSTSLNNLNYSKQENYQTNCDNLVTNQFDEQVYANFSEILKHDELENIDRRLF